MTRWALVLCLLAVLIGADRLTKISMMRRPDTGSASVSSSWITTTHHQNFGILADQRVPMPFILATTLIVILLVVIGLVRTMRNDDLRIALALCLILAGAIGNLWDRFAWGYVFDWILIGGTSIVNIADICIAVGILWYLFEMWRGTKTLQRAPEARA